MPKLTIIAGPGGSGKTWLCEKIAEETGAKPFPEATNVGLGDERGRAGHGRLPELVVQLLANELDCVMDEAHLVNIKFRQEFRRFCDTHLLGVQQEWFFFERNVLACINNVYADWNKMQRKDQSRFESLNKQLEVYEPPPLGEFPGHQKLLTVYVQPSPQFNDEARARAWLSDMALLHVYIPLGRKYTADQSMMAAKIVATLVNRQHPALTSMDPRTEKRKGMIYLDTTRNARGQACAAPYSARPYPGATVSAPLAWSEVNNGLDPAAFTIKTMFARVQKVGDLWQKVMGPGIDLNAWLEQVQKSSR